MISKTGASAYRATEMRLLQRPWRQRNLPQLRAQRLAVALPLRYKYSSLVFRRASTPLAISLWSNRRYSSSSNTSPSQLTMSGFYDLKAELPGGKAYSFEELKGKVVLIVNVASKWYAMAPFSDTARIPNLLV